MTSNRPTSLQFGPDGRLYVAERKGQIRAYTIQRTAKDNYPVTKTETISLVRQIPNHNDNGKLNTNQTGRLVTGILVAGTKTNPVIYASSSDPRVGGGTSDTNTNLDSNSGIISRLTWDGSRWVKDDLVKGLPRSEADHASNGMQLSADGSKLYLAQGGHTNQGAPSFNMVNLPEFALSAAILEINLDTIGGKPNQAPSQVKPYTLPTLDDETRTNQSNGSDIDDPFGGNNGKNQAKLDPTGPVQVYAPGFRNPYDLLITESGGMYATDNGGNSGWGNLPEGEGTPSCLNKEQTVQPPTPTNDDQLHLISGKDYYGGHPNPTRENTRNTFNPSNPQSPVPTDDNDVECYYRKPESALTTFPRDSGSSVNGLDEYTASNFGGVMKGNLIATNWYDKVHQIQLNSSPPEVNSTLFSLPSGSSNPLDITALGDGDPFPGTVWVANFNSSTIAVFEPSDYIG